MGFSSYAKRTMAAMMAVVLLLAAVACDTGTAPPGIADSQSGGSSGAEPQSPESGEPDSAQDPESTEGDPEDTPASEPEDSSEEPESSEPESGGSGAEPISAEPVSADAPEEAPPLKDPVSYVLYPYAAGTNVYGNSYAEIDVSNCSEGYCHIRYLGSGNDKIKVLITPNGGNTYQYILNSAGNYEVFPFSAGSGTYKIGVYQNVSGNQYAILIEEYVSVNLRNNLIPFLYPNQQVNFWQGSTTVATGAELARSAQSDLDIVSNVYNYTLNNVAYDYGKAERVSSGQIAFGYVPSVDNTLATGYGICFDYAAVMVAMLRTQQIPTKLVVGYAGGIYHAWISVYITDVGWVNGVLYFDGQSWKRMDPTFADNDSQSASIMNFINNSANYSAVYLY